MRVRLTFLPETAGPLSFAIGLDVERANAWGSTHLTRCFPTIFDFSLTTSSSLNGVGLNSASRVWGRTRMKSALIVPSSESDWRSSEVSSASASANWNERPGDCAVAVDVKVLTC